MTAPLWCSLAAAWISTSSAAGCPVEITAETFELSLDGGPSRAEDVTVVCLGPGGEPTARLRAASVRWEGERLHLTQARFTTCPFATAPPDWELVMPSAVVEPGRGIWARAPVLEVRGVPLAAAPVGWLPLGARRSGLLAPDGGWAAPFGFEARQPFYWAISRSWDATFTPEIASRRGPGLQSELRAAPAAGTELWLAPQLRFDFGAPRARGFAWARATPLIRWAADGTGRAEGAGLAVDLRLRGDPAWVAERAETFDRRADEYARSRVTVRSRRDRAVIGLHWLQDLRAATYRVAADDLRTVSTFGTGPGPGDVRHRLLEARWDRFPQPVFGLPMTLDVASRWHVATPLGEEEGRFVRADLRPELRWPAVWGGAGVGPKLVTEVWAAARATGWLGEGGESETLGGRLAPVLGTTAELELVVATERLGVVARPGVSAVVIPGVAESLPAAAVLVGDEIDLLGPVAQLAYRSESDFIDLERGERIGGTSIELGHDFGVAGVDGLGTLEVRGGLDYRWRFPGRGLEVESRVDATWSFAAASLREVVASADLGYRGRYGLNLGYVYLSEEPAATSFVAPEELVPSATAPLAGLVPADAYFDLPADAQAELRPVAETHAIAVGARAQLLPVLGWEGELTLAFDDPELLRRVYGAPASVVQSVRSALRFGRSGGCWSASLTAGTARDRGGWDVGVGLELSGLGSTASASRDDPS